MMTPSSDAHAKPPSPHLKTIFTAAAVCIAGGILLPTLTTGATAFAGFVLLEAGRLMASSAAKAKWPDDPDHSRAQHPVRAVFGFMEAASGNKDHPNLKPSLEKDVPMLLGLAGLGLAGGLALTLSSFGVVALGGIAIAEIGKFAGYRALRVLTAPGPKTI